MYIFIYIYLYSHLKHSLDGGVFSVLLVGLDQTGVPSALLGSISFCKYVVIIDGTIKNTWYEIGKIVISPPGF